MKSKRLLIPVNRMTEELNIGVAIERLSFRKLSDVKKGASDVAEQSHRHDGHSFFLLEKGTITMELDFKELTVKASSLIYVHPDQVHRTIASKNVIVSSWAISNENLNPGYLQLLEDMTPTKPLPLNKDSFSLLSKAVTLCIAFSERKTDKMYQPMLKDSCNALVALVISEYSGKTRSTEKPSRAESVTRSFRIELDKMFISTKRPQQYAQILNISAAYLNECVKNTTGHSVSYHIQQRVVLEAKRLIYHSDRSVKEIATELGFEDYPYFTRLFAKVTGGTALSFRAKNRD